MGFLQAMWALGGVEGGKGLEPFLVLPLEREGRVIRVHLKVEDPRVAPLNVLGLEKVDLGDFQPEPEMKQKYLFRKPVGSNVTWKFTPLHIMGKPKANREKVREALFGKGGDWHKEKSHFNSIRNKLLLDYEVEGALVEGSVDRIMAELESKIEDVLSDLDHKQSHLILFGVADKGAFLYPGEVPAFVDYFKAKLAASLQSKGTKNKAKTKKAEQRCAICGTKDSDFTSLNKVFKFSTDDKVNFIYGLDKERSETVFPICLSCLERTSGGRDRTERKLVNTTLLPGMRLWAIPEAVGEAEGIFLNLLSTLEHNLHEAELKTIAEKTEKRFFSQLARRENTGLVFHFVCWERNNAQELIHFMVEDVPPERLSFLEGRWGETIHDFYGEEKGKKLDSLDTAIRSLYKTLSRVAGKSEAERKVSRDFALKIIAKMLQGERVPAETFKKLINARTGKLIFDSNSWLDANESIYFAHIWVEYMNRLNARRKAYAS